MEQAPKRAASPFAVGLLIGLILMAVIGVVVLMSFSLGTRRQGSRAPGPGEDRRRIPGRLPVTCPHDGRHRGFPWSTLHMPRWKPDATLAEIADIWRGRATAISRWSSECSATRTFRRRKVRPHDAQGHLLNYENEPNKAYESLKLLHRGSTSGQRWAKKISIPLIYYQGVTALRRGETDNCVMCRGESSCILPISPAAVHTDATGSRLAIGHFTEYLERFRTTRRSAGCSTWPT